MEHDETETERPAAAPPRTEAPRPRSPARADRLAEALRRNLHRRKAQARARRSAPDAADETES